MRSSYVELAERLERAWDTTPDRRVASAGESGVGELAAALEWALGKRGDSFWATLGSCTRGNVAQLSRSPKAALGAAAHKFVDERTPLGLIAQLEHAEAEGARRFGESKCRCRG